MWRGDKQPDDERSGLGPPRRNRPRYAMTARLPGDWSRVGHSNEGHRLGEGGVKNLRPPPGRIQSEHVRRGQ